MKFKSLGEMIRKSGMAALVAVAVTAALSTVGCELTAEEAARLSSPDQGQSGAPSDFGDTAALSSRLICC